MKRFVILLAAGIAAGVPLMPALAAPATSDKCTYNGNGIQSNANEARSCVSVGTGGVPLSYGQPNEDYYAAIGNGQPGNVHQATTSSSNNGWTNAASATSNSANVVSASSSLVDGTLHGYIANGFAPYTTGSGINTRISDVITFDNSTGAALALTLGYSFDGSFSGTSKNDYNDGFVFLALNQPSGYYGPIRFTNSGGYVASDAKSTFDAANGTFSQTTSNIAAQDYTFTGGFNTVTGLVEGAFSTSLLIPIGKSDLGFALTLLLDCRTIGAVCDFSHTGRFALDTLPQGLTYTSRSGVLFSGSQPPAGAVPEPATWAMMVGGFGLVGGTLRRRRPRIAVA